MLSMAGTSEPLLLSDSLPGTSEPISVTGTSEPISVTETSEPISVTETSEHISVTEPSEPISVTEISEPLLLSDSVTELTTPVESIVIFFSLSYVYMYM